MPVFEDEYGAFLNQVISPQRFNWGKAHAATEQIAPGVLPYSFRSSVPQILRPVEFAPVTLIYEGYTEHDELGVIYYAVLNLRHNLQGGDTRSIENQKVAIDTHGLVYKRNLPHHLQLGHEYGYFADPDLYDEEERAVRRHRGKNREEHLMFEKKGYISPKPYMPAKKDEQMHLF